MATPKTTTPLNQQDLIKLLHAQHHELALTHESLRQELKLGAQIHDVLLTGKLPTTLSNVTVDAITVPSKEIGGDFYDFYHSSPAAFDLVIGDVMGKGIPSALVATAVKTQLIRFASPFTHAQICARRGFWYDDLPSPEEILNRVAGEVSGQLVELGYFVSLFYGRFNFHTKRFTYLDCGSPKPLHYKAAEKKTSHLRGNNFPLGMVLDDKYRQSETLYDKGDIFVFFSDGVTETRSPSGELFGEKRLAALTETHSDATPSRLVSTIQSAVLDFAGKDSFDDDATMLVVKISDDDTTTSSKLRMAKFTNDLSQLPAVRRFVGNLCHGAPGDHEKLSTQLQLAINEVFCNIAKHSKSARDVIIKGEQTDDGIILEASDQGTPFNPLEIPEPSLAGDQSAGFGVYVIRGIADQISYTPKETDSGWNSLRIFKRYVSLEGPMELAHTTHDDVLVITLNEEHLDASSSANFKEQVLGLIDTQSQHNLVFDLEHLQFIDSSGLGGFLSILRFLNTEGGDLKLANMTKPARAMFEIVRMHKLFEIFNSTEDAVHSFN